MRSLPSVLLVASWLLAAAPAHAQRTHVVRTGETIVEIAARHGVSLEALLEANERAGRLRPGDRLRIPGRGARPSAAARPGRRRTARAPDGESPQPQPDEPAPAAPILEETPPPLDEAEAAALRARATELGLGSMAVGQRLLREAPEPRWVQAAGSAEDAQGTLSQPVPGGLFLRGWGSGDEGYHLAIDIGAPTGTEIHAAERGLVAYVGAEIRGYGNMVIVVHPNAWVTAYAHNDRNLVVPGQIVDRGHLLATVGETGYAQGPHLHFFLVHDGRHCDPLPLVRPRLERSGGRAVEALELVWDAELRPSGIRCLFRAQAPHPYRRWQAERERADQGR